MSEFANLTISKRPSKGINDMKMNKEKANIDSYLFEDKQWTTFSNLEDAEEKPKVKNHSNNILCKSQDFHILS